MRNVNCCRVIGCRHGRVAGNTSKAVCFIFPWIALIPCRLFGRCKAILFWFSPLSAHIYMCDLCVWFSITFLNVAICKFNVLAIYVCLVDTCLELNIATSHGGIFEAMERRSIDLKGSVCVAGFFDRRRRSANIALKCIDVVGGLASDEVAARSKHASGSDGREESENTDGCDLHICDDAMFGPKRDSWQTEGENNLNREYSARFLSWDRQEKEWPASREDS